MKFEYTVNENDYLDFQLYTASKGERFEKKKTNGKYFLTICSLITACYFFYIKDWGMLAYFGLTGVVFFFLYPTYFRWRQKVHYIKFIRRNYRSLFGSKETLEVQGKNLMLVNSTGEGVIKNAEINSITEISSHFFVNLTSGTALIIPKSELSDPASFLREIKNIKIKQVQDLNWRW